MSVDTSGIPTIELAKRFRYESDRYNWQAADQWRDIIFAPPLDNMRPAQIRIMIKGELRKRGWMRNPATDNDQMVSASRGDVTINIPFDRCLYIAGSPDDWRAELWAYIRDELRWATCSAR